MQIYGKEMRETEEPASLQEVTLVMTQAEVGDLIRFLSTCVDDMRSNPEWEHAHPRDFLKMDGTAADVVVFAASKLGSHGEA